MSAPAEIDVATLAAQLAGDDRPALLDVREDWEHQLVALPDALHVPMGEVQARLASLPRDVPLVVYCHHGGRSAHVTELLRTQGFEQASNLAGGIDAWARQIDTSLPRY